MQEQPSAREVLFNTAQYTYTGMYQIVPWYKHGPSLLSDINCLT